jgi:hypothetical protein
VAGRRDAASGLCSRRPWARVGPIRGWVRAGRPRRQALQPDDETPSPEATRGRRAASWGGFPPMTCNRLVSTAGSPSSPSWSTTTGKRAGPLWVRSADPDHPDLSRRPAADRYRDAVYGPTGGHLWAEFPKNRPGEPGEPTLTSTAGQGERETPREGPVEGQPAPRAECSPPAVGPTRPATSQGSIVEEPRRPVRPRAAGIRSHPRPQCVARCGPDSPGPLRVQQASEPA